MSKLISKISTYAAHVAIGANSLILVFVLTEIVARAAFGTSLLITVEMTSWLLLASSFLGTAWTLKENGHVKIDILTECAPARVKAAVALLVHVAATVLFVLFAYYVWQDLVEKYVTKATGETIFRFPLWWAYCPFFAGAVTFALQFVALTLDRAREAAAVFAGDRPAEEGSAVLGWTLAALGLLFAGIVLAALFVPSFATASPVILLLAVLGILFALILSGMWIFMALGLTGCLALSLFTTYPATALVTQTVFFASSDFVLVCLPLFVFMGELLFCSGASNKLYEAVAPWVEKVPGGLLHSNILSCTLFAAVSGSSAVTTATIGSVAVPALKRMGYDEGLTLGSLAGAGTLGLLIPPSIVLIIYGAITTESIGQLFVAGLIPGLLLSFMFMGYIALRAVRDPSVAPRPDRMHTWAERFRLSVGMLPVVSVIGLVFGLIYGGVATPTEASAVGAAAAIAITVINGRMTFENFMNASYATIRTTSMIILVMAFAGVLSTSIAYLRIPQELAEILAAANLSKYLVLAILCLIYLVLGFLFDGASMMVLTLPIVYPLIIKMGFDGIWFGIILTILIEIAQITPPVGFNLYVLQSISGQKISLIVRSAMPFFFVMCAALLILIVFPDLVTMLPRGMTALP
ncbi:TRAP transporter large permease [Shumkonia mesophila]|uniref:TRAP transporter large permease n=1 Tax=Shumkonia mesophila TaxID=2838854 RepID=UPI002934A062|nr:TRAP transporter large permease subunit [Shumkonia mesophila]